VPEHTLAVLVAVAAVLALELLWLRTGLLRRVSYWIALAICLAFQVPVEGWLTKLSAPVFSFDADAITGVRFPWDIPVEDFGYSFALITLTLLLWERARRAEPDAVEATGAARSGGGTGR
jgi:lycopene cyclase domain-containing protein